MCVAHGSMTGLVQPLLGHFRLWSHGLSPSIKDFNNTTCLKICSNIQHLFCTSLIYYYRDLFPKFLYKTELLFVQYSQYKSNSNSDLIVEKQLMLPGFPIRVNKNVYTSTAMLKSLAIIFSSPATCISSDIPDVKQQM